MIKDSVHQDATILKTQARVRESFTYITVKPKRTKETDIATLESTSQHSSLSANRKEERKISRMEENSTAAFTHLD